MYCIEELLFNLKNYQDLSTELKKYNAFSKLSSLNKNGQLYSICCTVNNQEVLIKELQELTGEKQRTPNNFESLQRVSVTSFSIDENKIFLKLDRLSTVKSVFKEIFECQNIYGSSNKFCNKAVRLSYGESKNELTVMRMKIVGDVVAGLVVLGGGSVVDSTDADSVVHIASQRPSSILVGPVHVAGSTDTSTANYLRLRRAELEKNDNRELCEQTAEQQIGAAVVFDLLSVKLSKPLILDSSIDLPASARRCNNKGVTFVLYNYARICSILDKFEDMVSNGVYKPLTAFHDLDYNLLLKEEEWMLVFDFLAQWPAVVTHCQDLTQPKLHTMITFLSDLATTFSVFYKYNRVLNEGLDHMVPLMEARIYLLKAIKEVFLVGFSLLKINAPTKM